MIINGMHVGPHRPRTLEIGPHAATLYRHILELSDSNLVTVPPPLGGVDHGKVQTAFSLDAVHCVPHTLGKNFARVVSTRAEAYDSFELSRMKDSFKRETALEEVLGTRERFPGFAQP